MHCLMHSHPAALAGKDFGGRREAGDVDVAATAGREFSEETLGLFSSCSVNSESVRLSTLQMTAQLRRRELVREVVQQLREVQAAARHCD